MRALLLALALLVAAPAAAPAQDGRFLKLPGADPVYRVVGGAPLWVGTCAVEPSNDCEPLQLVASLDAFPRYPADGAVAYQYDNGAIYRFAGGAPLWLESCDYAPGCAGAIRVDKQALTLLGNVRQYPADGTVVENVSEGSRYRFAGGAPLFVRCDGGAPGCANAVRVDAGTFARLGGYDMAPRMRRYPADGTTVRNVDTGVFYRFAGNTALPLSGCDGCAAVVIDNITLERAGTASPSRPHIAPVPAEGTYLTTGTTAYRIAGGAAVQLADCAPLGGCPGAVAVDAGTIAGLGGGRLRPVPGDGTVLRGLPSKRTWEIVGGKRRETFIARLDAIEVDDGAIGLIPVDAPPPPPPVPEVFKPVISSGYKVLRRYTRFTSLKVRDALPGSVVTVSCDGGRKRGCPFSKAKQYRLTGTTLNVYSRWLKRAKLRSRAEVTVRVTSPTGARKQQTFEIRSRKLPVRKTRCSAPGAKFSRCA